jgi:CRP-like cAMP-binding protein
MSASFIATLNATDLFGPDGLRPAELAGLGALRRRFAAGERLYPRGREVPVLFLVESGSVNIVLRSGSGKWLVKEAGEGDLFGEMRSVGLTMLRTEAVAQASCSVLRLGTGAAVELMSRAGARWGALQAPMLYDCLMDRHRIKFATTESRLAPLLLALAGDDGVIRGVTQQDIADQLGLTREALWVVIDRLMQEGLLDWRRSAITLLDIEGLRRYGSLRRNDGARAPGRRR